MIEFQNVSAGYGGRRVVEGVSFTVPRGAVASLIGPNGQGKTTLLRTAGGLLAPQAGRVLLNGKPVGDYRRRELARLAATLPQIRETPAITVERLAAHGRYPHLGFGRELAGEDRVLVERALEEAGVRDLRDRDLASLSGGERQRAYIAMALAQDSQVLLLDEPTTYLDVGQRYEVLELVRRLNARGKTVLMVLHDLSLAFGYSDYVALVNRGGLRAFGSAEEVFRSGAAEAAFGVRSARLPVGGKERYLFFN